MKYNERIQNPEDSLIFMRSLTFIGGFLNAYSYYTRGGAFVSFHTGNFVRIGLSILERNSIKFWSSFIPIMAAFLGAIISSFLKYKITTESNLYFKRIILIEIIVFFIIGFIKSDSLNNVINFILSMIAMFQLTSFRRIKNISHNTTIMTGNIRTLAQLFSNWMIEKKNKKNLVEFISYFITFISFLVGVIAGGVISLTYNKFAIWLCVFILAVLFLNLNKKEKMRLN